jgi:hypothetical protein
MEPLPIRRSPQSRVPLTITLDTATYKFVEACAARKEFRSVDDFFEAALTIFKNHLDALMAYVELQEAKGMTLEEIKSSTQYEIVFSHHQD